MRTGLGGRSHSGVYELKFETDFRGRGLPTKKDNALYLLLKCTKKHVPDAPKLYARESLKVAKNPPH